jgi:hypothetical protein
VDDILIVYDRQKTIIEKTLEEFNNMQPTIKFTIEKEQKEKINYLYITIQRKNERLEFTIYRKPTQTDIVIPNSSCQPYEHKLSGINFLLNRVRTYTKTTKAKQTEIHNIKNILQRNEYKANLIEKTPTKSRKLTHMKNLKRQNGPSLHIAEGK